MKTPNNNEDRGKFKIPHLKNIALTSPYMHDGRMATLEEVVEFYSAEIQAAANLAFTLNTYYTPVFPQLFTGFNFMPTEKSALVAFLDTLTDENFNSDARWSDSFVVQAPTGFSNTETEGLHISPNPVLTYADIRISADNDLPKIVQLFDINGTKVWENQIFGQYIRFLRNGLPSGNYFLKIQIGKKSNTTRLMLL